MILKREKPGRFDAGDDRAVIIMLEGFDKPTGEKLITDIGKTYNSHDALLASLEWCIEQLKNSHKMTMTQSHGVNQAVAVLEEARLNETH